MTARPRRSNPLFAVLALGAHLAIGGCMTFQPIEPKLFPPTVFQSDTVVATEFVHPARVSLRCVERGATFMGLPGLNSGACSDADLMTLPNPCDTFTAGWYARVLCTSISPAPSSGEGRLYKASLGAAPLVRVEYVDPSALALRCAERGVRGAGNVASGIGACADETLVTMPNPCANTTAGWYADVLCHELAHVNGWPSNHAGGSYWRQPRLINAGLSPEMLVMRARERAMAEIPTLAAGNPGATVTLVAMSASTNSVAPVAVGGEAAPAEGALGEIDAWAAIDPMLAGAIDAAYSTAELAADFADLSAYPALLDQTAPPADARDWLADMPLLPDDQDEPVLSAELDALFQLLDRYAPTDARLLQSEAVAELSGASATPPAPEHT